MAIKLAREVIFSRFCQAALKHILKHSKPEHARNLMNAFARILGRTFIEPKRSYGRRDTSGYIYIYTHISATVPQARAASLSSCLSSGSGSGSWSGSGLGLDLGPSWWEEAILIGPTHVSPLLAPLIPGPSGLLFGLSVFL